MMNGSSANQILKLAAMLDHQGVHDIADRMDKLALLTDDYTGWIDPKGEFYDLGANTNHRQWAFENMKTIEDLGYDTNVKLPAGLIEQGWLRKSAGDFHIGTTHWQKQLELIEKHIEQQMLQNLIDVNNEITIDIQNDNPKAYEKRLPEFSFIKFHPKHMLDAGGLLPLIGDRVAKIVAFLLHRDDQSNTLNRTAANSTPPSNRIDRMYEEWPKDGWIDPKGNQHELKFDGNYREEHHDWVKNNRDLIKQLGYSPPKHGSYKDTYDLVGQGWTRYGWTTFHIGTTHWEKQLKNVERKILQIAETIPNFMSKYGDKELYIDISDDLKLGRHFHASIFTTNQMIEAGGLINLLGRDISKAINRPSSKSAQMTNVPRFTRQAMAHGPVPPEFQPRTIKETDLPEDATIMYHATTDLPGVQELGLVSQDERREWEWPGAMGIGGGSPNLVSLTRNRQIAEDIARAMLDMKAIVSTKTPQEATTAAENAVRRIAEQYGLNSDAIINEGRRMYSYVFEGNKLEDPDKIAEDFQDMMNRYVYKQTTGFSFPTIEELPEGTIIIQTWPHGNDGNKKVWKWKEPEPRSEWLWKISHYFDYMLQAAENAGGPTSPLFFQFDEERFSNFEPENVGVADVLVTGPPDRGWDEEYYPDWKTAPGALREWAGLPSKTKVVLR